MEIKNLKRIVVFIAVLITALAVRLGYIQLASHDELADAVESQSRISLEGSNTRGIIYDKFGEALVADIKQYVYIIGEENFNNKAKSLLRKMNAEPLRQDNKGYHVYSSYVYSKEYGKELIDECDAYILQSSSRYSSDQPAVHLIGYVNKKDSSGAAGLELMYDDQLSIYNRRVFAAADVRGNLLPGRGLVIKTEAETDSYAEEGIRITIDKELQIEVEDIIEENEKNCAVVVLECRTGGVAAMACTPDFDPADADKHVLGSGDVLVNKATQGEYPPGSIFKIVVAAAALENGTSIEKSYMCEGHVELEEITIGCDTGGEEGHGEISFEDAFAQSCNSYFIQLAEETGADRVIEMAERLGFGAGVLDGYPHESKGHLMTEAERSGDAVGNLGIGQGETLVTPLQVAAMTNIIACRGVDKGVHLLLNEETEDKRIVSEETASEICAMMELVSLEGTGGIISADLDGKPKAAVKTGTAEYGNKEEGRTHGWMTGFTPCGEPEYVITVLVEDGGSGSAAAGPVFKKIIEYLEESGSYSKETLT